MAAAARHPEPRAERGAALPLALFLTVGLALRLVLLWHEPGLLHPDEIYQYVEPAHWFSDGSGVLAWEFERGLRNWVAPALYGALLELAELLGLRGLDALRFLQIHNALWSLLLIPAGWRIGRVLRDNRLAGVLALALALFPLLAWYGARTLSETLGLLATTWAAAFWLESATGRGDDRLAPALKAGVLLGLAGVARYTLLLFAVPVALDLLLRRDWRAFWRFGVGLGAVLVALGVFDALVWGRPFHTLIEYVSFNLLEGGADTFGTAPAEFYWQRLFVDGLGAARFLLVVPALLLWRRTWRPLLYAAAPLLVLSMVPHKEERFLLSVWPALLAASLAGLLALVDWVTRALPLAPHRRRAAAAIFTAAAALTICGASLRSSLRPYVSWSAGLLAAQDYVGRQSDAAGLLTADGFGYRDGYSWLSGGYTVLDRTIPQLAMDAALLEHHLFNYVITANPLGHAWVESRSDFAEVARFAGDVRVYRRRPAERSQP